MFLELLAEIVYSIVTLLYGSVFTILFLDVSLGERRNMVSFICFNICALLVQGWVVYVTSVETVVNFYPLIVHLPLALLCIIYYGKSTLTTVSAILMCYFLTSPRYVLAEVIAALFWKSAESECICKIIATFLLVVPIYRFMVPVVKKGFQREKREVMHFFVPLILVYTLSYLLYIYTDMLTVNGVFVVEMLFTLFFVIVLYCLQKYFVSVDDNMEKENRNQILVMSTEALKKQLDILNESNEQTRILRHDMRYYAMMVKQYARLGELDKVVQICEEMEAKNDAVAVKKYCSNQWINLLLNSSLVQFETMGITPKLEISVPDRINIHDMDCCVVLGNVLENAVRSVAASKGEKFCHVLLRYDEGKLFLEVQNSCESPVTFREGIPVSGRKGHGYGCRSIVYITEKYHGIYAFGLQENIFSTQVILHEQ